MLFSKIFLATKDIKISKNIIQIGVDYIIDKLANLVSSYTITRTKIEHNIRVLQKTINQ